MHLDAYSSSLVLIRLWMRLLLNGHNLTLRSIVHLIRLALNCIHIIYSVVKKNLISIEVLGVFPLFSIKIYYQSKANVPMAIIDTIFSLVVNIQAPLSMQILFSCGFLAHSKHAFYAAP